MSAHFINFILFLDKNHNCKATLVQAFDVVRQLDWGLCVKEVGRLSSIMMSTAIQTWIAIDGSSTNLGTSKSSKQSSNGSWSQSDIQPLYAVLELWIVGPWKEEFSYRLTFWWQECLMNFHKQSKETNKLTGNSPNKNKISQKDSNQVKKFKPSKSSSICFKATCFCYTYQHFFLFLWKYIFDISASLFVLGFHLAKFHFSKIATNYPLVNF